MSVMGSFFEITLVLPTLCYGGAERAMVNMANWWARGMVPVNLITFDKRPSPYPLAPEVRRIAIDEQQADAVAGDYAVWPEEAVNIGRLRAALTATGPGPVVSFLTKMNVRTLCALQGSARRVFVSERAFPPYEPLPESVHALRGRLYPHAAGITVLTEQCKREWGDRNFPPHMVHVTPISSERVAFDGNTGGGEAHCALPEKFMLATGRLELQKGFDLLLHALALAVKKCPDIRLIVAGEGSQREVLQELCSSLGLEEHVSFPGIFPRLDLVMHRAMGFVLSSRYEGFCNTMLEALGHGLPVLAFDCPAGPGEVLRGSGAGILVEAENIEELAQAMTVMWTDEALRKRLAAQAPSALTPYALELVMARWNALLEVPSPGTCS